MPVLNAGVGVTGPVVPKYATDVYAAHRAIFGQGGWRTVADHATRNALTTSFPKRCEQGMVVVTLDDGVAWQLGAALTGTDADWSIFGVAVVFSPRTSCRVATTANLTATYANGSSGVGATLTNSGTQAALAIDGVTLSVNDRFLVKDQTAQAQNGIYTVTNTGSGSTNWVLTRAADYDQASEVAEGTYTVVAEGTANTGTIWMEANAGPFTIGTTAITWIKIPTTSLPITLTGAVTGSGTGTIATTIPDASIVYAQVQNVAATTLLGNPGSSPGPPSEITLGANLSFVSGQLTVTAGAGTVTDLSVNTAHGFAGTVSNPTTTPAITISTTVTGLLKGNGTSISAATSGVDYLVSNQTITLSGDVTGSGSTSITTTIAASAVTTGKLAAGAVTEPKITLSDVTTANASTLTHGFLPKLPGDDTVYLDGTGAFSTPPGTGGGALSPSLTDSHIFVGNSSNVATGRAVTGDIGLNSLGVVTVGGINGVGLGSTAANAGNLLIGSGSVWVTHAITGDLSLTAGGVATVSGHAITYAKLQQASAHVLLGNPGSGTGSVQEITLGGSPNSLAFNAGTLIPVGGLLTVADHASRNAIPDSQRAEGMIVYTQNTTGSDGLFGYWQLLPLPWADTDADWAPAGPLDVQHNGTDVAARGAINFIDGSNVTLTVADNPTDDRVDITIDATGGGGGGSGTVNSGTSGQFAIYASSGTAVSGHTLTAGNIPLTTGHILVGSSSVAADVAMSGDVTISSSGVTTISNSAVTTAKINAGAVTEAKLTLADNTTANVSTSAHGFAPKAPNDATKYLDGTGAYSVPPGSGGTVTQVATDGTLTGGPITTTGTLGVATSAALPGSPTTTTQSSSDSSTKLATTAFVQAVVSNAIAGVNPAVAAQAATTAAGDTSGLTYSNGASGVGATLTGANNTALAVDGYTFTAIGQRLLVKNDTQSPSGAFNGVYSVTQLQATLLPLILTRTLDFDQPSDINNTGAIPVLNGTANSDTSWVVSSTVNTVGTDPITFAKFSASPANLLGNSLTNTHIFVGNSSNQATDVTMSGDATISNSGVITVSKIGGTSIALPVSIANGGTGQATATAAFDALSPLTTLGDVPYFDGTHNVRLAGQITTSRKFLTQTGTGAASAALIWNLIAGSDLPNPSSSTLGGVQSVAAVTSNWIDSISTGGVPHLSQPAFGDISGTITTAQIGAAQVTYAKIQNVAASRLLGNPTGSAAAPSEISLGANLSFSGTSLVISGGATGSILDGYLLANETGGAAAASGHSLTDYLDYVLGTTAGNLVVRGSSTWAAASTGLKIDQHYGTIIAATDGATITFDLSLGDWQSVTLGGNRTLALSNPTTGQQFTLRLKQAASGGPYAPTWFSGITWFTSTFSAPTMPTTASGVMVCTFKCTGSGAYDGFLAGTSAS